MKRLLHEPLVHFLLLGAVLFVAFDVVGRRAEGATGTIAITRVQVAAMSAEFAKTWQRPPTAAELQALIDERVREEVYCREAVALGLDKDDELIRRRLRQKMEFVAGDAASPAEAQYQELLQKYVVVVER